MLSNCGILIKIKKTPYKKEKHFQVGVCKHLVKDEKLQIPFTFLKGYYHATKTILNVIRCFGEARWHISPIMDRYESNEIKPSIAWEFPSFLE